MDILAIKNSMKCIDCGYSGDEGSSGGVAVSECRYYKEVTYGDGTVKVYSQDVLTYNDKVQGAPQWELVENLSELKGLEWS